MTGNKIAWRAPLAGLASVAMLATMGVAAGTANAAFKPSQTAATYTVTLDVSGQAGAVLGNDVLAKLRVLDTDFTSKTDDKTDVEVTLNSTKEDKATKATVENVPADKPVSDLVANPTAPVERAFNSWQVGGYAVDTTNAKVTGDMDLKGRFAYTGNTAEIKFTDAVENQTVTLVKGDKLADWQIGKVNPALNGQIKGWNTDRVATEAMDLSKLDTTKDQTLYPIYGVTHTVTYMAGEPYAVSGDKGYYVAGTAFEAMKGEDVSPTQKFVGWYETKDSSAAYDAEKNPLAAEAFDFTKGLSKDTVLYAKYAAAAPTSTVTFYYADGAKYGTDDVTTGTPVSKPADPTDNTDKGRAFLYWTAVADGSANAENRAEKEYAWSQNVSAPLSLYAVWGESTKVDSVTVTFDENWQDGAITEVESNEDGTFTVADPVREGYVFKGWAKSAQETNYDNAVDLSDKDEVKDLANTTVYAMWQDPAETEAEAKLKQAMETLKSANFTDASFKAYVNTLTGTKNVKTDLKDGVLKVSITATDAAAKAEAVKAVLAAQGKLVEVAKTEVLRLYNPNDGDHYFTTNMAEAALLSGIGWKYEGVKFTTASGYNGLNEALYSVYNANTGEHLLAFEAEADFLATQGWDKQDEAMWTLANGPKDVYRAYNPNTTGPAHVYVEKGEAEALARLGWSIDNAGEPVFKLK